MAISSSSPPNPPSYAAPRLFSHPPPPSGNKTPIYPHFPATATAAFHSRHPDYATVAPRLQHVLLSLNRQPPADRGILYPPATSGRGFLPKPTTASDQPVVMTNPGGFPPRPFAPNLGRVPYGSQPSPLIRPTHLPHSLLSSTGGVVKDIPISTHPKTAVSPSSVSDCNGYKDIRERRREDSFATVRDRKVRVSDGGSLYAQCRSWLRNGFPEESQSQYVDIVKSLPRPFPIPVGEAHSPEKREGDIAEKEFCSDRALACKQFCLELDDRTKDEGDVDHLLPKELLQRHIKRAKRVRARLREERLQRIARYKSRLALLLPPIVEQQIRNDNAPKLTCLTLLPARYSLPH